MRRLSEPSLFAYVISTLFSWHGSFIFPGDLVGGSLTGANCVHQPVPTQSTSDWKPDSEGLQYMHVEGSRCYQGQNQQSGSLWGGEHLRFIVLGRKNIRLFNGCEVRIENSVTRVTFRHHVACRVMPDSYPEWQNFQFAPSNHFGFFFCIHFPQQ